MRGRQPGYHHCRAQTFQDTAAESKEPVIGESEVIGVLHFGFLFPFVSIKEISRAGYDGMGNPEAMAPEVPDLLRSFR